MLRIKYLLVALAILALAVVLGACGGSDDSQPAAEVEVTPAANIAEQAPPKEEEPAPAEEPEEEAPAKEAAGEQVAVDIKDFAFAPQALQVKVGDVVEFTNSDSAPHTATASSGSDFDSGNLSQGDTFEWKADKAGSVEYLCAVHPSMTGTIEVQ